MNQQSDFELLRQFVRNGEQAAFGTVVRRHLDLVYATALRKVEDTGAAEEIAQNVFTALARKAWQFAPDDSLPAWLHRTALLESKSWWRGELRRRRREHTAIELGTTMKTSDEQAALRALTPLLDEALLSLRAKERTALLLRFYERRSLHEVGAALGIREDAAQKRVVGALEKIAAYFQRRGFRTATIAAVTAAFQTSAVSVSKSTETAVLTGVLQVAPPAATGLMLALGWLARLTTAHKLALGGVLLIAAVIWSINEVRLARVPATEIETIALASMQEGDTQGAVWSAERLRAPERRSSSQRPMVEATGEVEEERHYTTTLTGIIELPDFRAACLTVRFQFGSNTTIRTKHSFIGEGRRSDVWLGPGRGNVVFELVSVDCSIGRVNARENGIDVEYVMDRRDAVLEGGTSNLAIWTVDTDVHSVLDVYSELSERTLLLHPQIKPSFLSTAASAQNRAEAAMALKKAFDQSGIAIFPDGEKFEMAVPITLAEALSGTRKASERAGSQSAEIPACAIHLLNVDVRQVVVIYGELIGRKPIQTGDLVGAPIALRTPNGLTRAEAMYALETLLEWRDLKLEMVGDDSFTFVRIPRRR